MATNENDIGVRARFIMEDFDKHVQEYNAKLAQANKATDTFYKQQNDAIAKSSAAAKDGADAQTKSIGKVVSGFRSSALVLAGITAGIVVGYKELRDAAERLGDSETMEAFKAVDDSFANLKDSIAGVLLEAVPFDVMIHGLADGFTALSQVITLSAGAATGFGTRVIGILDLINARIDEMRRGQIFTSAFDIGAELDKIEAASNEAANRIIIAGATAPERAKATSEAAARAKEAEKAREQNAQKLADYISKINDLQTKSGESLLDAERDYQDKSASAWQSYIEKVSDIVAEGIKKRAELTRTYNDAIAKAEQDYARGAETAAYNHGKALADIERDYQDSVRAIQQTYQEDALDAVRNLDAIGLIRARERRDKDLANASQTRDRQIADEQENYSRSLYELSRALADKRAEAEDAYQRGLDDQRRAEQETTQEAKDALNKQNAEAKRAYDERLAAIKQSYANERTEAQAHYLQQEAALRAHLEAMRAIMAQYGMDLGAGATSPIVGGGTRRRAEGGVDVVSSPTNFVAGEAGPELVLTAPMNRALPSPVSQTLNLSGDFSHRIEAAVMSSVAGLDGRIIATVRKAISEVVR